MKDDNKKKYITFALPMLRMIFTERDAIDTIMMYGAYRASLHIDVDIKAAFRQLMYMAARHREQVPDELYLLVRDYFNDDPADSLSDCMDDKEIAPEYVDEFQEKYTHASANILEWYRVYQIQDVAGVNTLDIPRTLYTGRELSEYYRSGQVPVFVAPKTLYAFRESIRTDYDKVRAAMYLGIRSLCKDGVAVTTSTAIKWRMMGCKNQAELDKVLEDETLRAIYLKWGGKRQYRNLLNDLITSNLILEMPYCRRTCVTAFILDEGKFVEAVMAKIRKIYAKRREDDANKKRQHLLDMFCRSNSVPL